MKRRFFDVEESEFIQLRDGQEYIRKFEVVGLRWKPFVPADGGDLAWGLQVYFNDAPFSTFYGDDAASIMKAFSLPEEPPKQPKP